MYYWIDATAWWGAGLLLYRWFGRENSLHGQRLFLWSFLVLGLVLPFDFRFQPVDSGDLAGAGSFFERKWWDQVWYRIQAHASGKSLRLELFLGMIYFAGLTRKAFGVSDRYFRQGGRMPELALDGLGAVAWFHPLFPVVRRVLDRMKPRPVRRYWSSLFVGSLLGLAFLQLHAPASRFLAGPVEWLNQPLFIFPLPPEKPDPVLEWGGQTFSLTRMEKDGFLQLDFQETHIPLEGLTPTFQDESIRRWEGTTFLRDSAYAYLLEIEGLDGRRWAAAIGHPRHAAEMANSELEDVNGLRIRWQGQEWTNWYPAEPAYELEWGDWKVPLHLQANPDQYVGEIVAEAADWERVRNQPIRLRQDGAALDWTSLELTQYRAETRENLRWEVALNFGAGRVTPFQWGLIQLAPGDRLQITGKAGMIQVALAEIRFKSPAELFKPGWALEEVNREIPAYQYQLIMREGRKTRLKTDTALAENAALLNLYRDRTKYEVVHVPGFITNNRLKRYEAENPWTPEYPDSLPEYGNIGDQPVWLEIGDLFASPVSPVYTPAEWNQNKDQPWKCRIGQEEWKIRRAAVLVEEEGQPAVLRPQAWIFTLPEVLPRTVVKIGCIELENGQILPLNFAFVIGEAGLEVAVKAVEDTQSRTFQSDTSLCYSGYYFSELVALFTSRRPNRLEFEGLEEDPLLEVCVHFPAGQDPGKAPALVLNALQKTFRFELIDDRLAQVNWKIQVAESERLEQALYKASRPPQTKVAAVDPVGVHVFTGITLWELAGFLEDRFGYVFDYPVWFRSRQYVFILEMYDFDSVRRQLREEYGIALGEHDWVFDGIRVRFLPSPGPPASRPSRPPGN